MARNENGKRIRCCERLDEESFFAIPRACEQQDRAPERSFPRVSGLNLRRVGCNVELEVAADRYAIRAEFCEARGVGVALRARGRKARESRARYRALLAIAKRGAFRHPRTGKHDRDAQ